MLRQLIAMMSGGGGPGGDATWNGGDKTTNLTLSGGNLTAAADTSNFEMVRTTRANLNTGGSGKFYVEINVDTLAASNDMWVGMKAAADAIVSGGTPLGGTFALWRSSGANSVANWTDGGGATTYAAGDVLMLAIDEAAGKVWTGKNNTWNNSGDPAAGTGESFSGMPAGNHAILFSTDNVAGAVQATLVTSAGSLTYSAPSGFTAGLPNS